MQVLPVANGTERILHSLQVSAASTLGALAVSTSGVVCDHAWLRLLGAGTRELRFGQEHAEAVAMQIAGQLPTHAASS